MSGEFFDGVCLVAVGDEESVVGLHDDEVIDAKEGDFDAFLIIEDNVVFGVDEGEVAVGSVGASLPV